MSIELSKEDKQQATASIERYFRENMEEKIGNVAAGGLLGFILEEIGPSICNKGVADAQERIQARAQELDFEVHQAERQRQGTGPARPSCLSSSSRSGTLPLSPA